MARRNNSPGPSCEPKRQKHRNASTEMYLEPYNFRFCEDASKYTKLEKVGQGSFGEVFRACEVNDRTKIVAMKSLVIENGTVGFPITAIREIRILQCMRNTNIVRLLDLCQIRGNHYDSFQAIYYMVFEFCEHDLAGLLLNKKVVFKLSEIKDLLKQILNGLQYIHGNKIIHRDIKAANILITNNGVLKLADFGLARAWSNRLPNIGIPNRFTNRVVTLWFRCPELLLGEHNYGPGVDMWGFGCVMAEMWTRFPIIQGTSEQMQLILTTHLCGSITPEIWPNVQLLELYNKIELPQGETRKVKERLGPYIQDPLGIDLLDKLLTLDPAKRIDADTALNHRFFWSDPIPTNISRVLSRLTHNNFEYIIRRQDHHFKVDADVRPSSTAVVNQGASTSEAFKDLIF